MKFLLGFLLGVGVTYYTLEWNKKPPTGVQMQVLQNGHWMPQVPRKTEGEK